MKKKVEQKIAIGNLLLSSPLFRLAAPKHPLFFNPPIVGDKAKLDVEVLSRINSSDKTEGQYLKDVFYTFNRINNVSWEEKMFTSKFSLDTIQDFFKWRVSCMSGFEHKLIALESQYIFLSRF